MRQDDGGIEIEMEVISGAAIVIFISIILIDFRIEFHQHFLMTYRFRSFLQVESFVRE